MRGHRISDLEQQQTLTVQEAIDLAVQHHNAGRLSDAEIIYQRILQADPNHPIALHLLGVIAHQTGNNNKAEAKIAGITPAEFIFKGKNELSPPYILFPICLFG